MGRGGLQNGRGEGSEVRKGGQKDVQPSRRGGGGGECDVVLTQKLEVSTILKGCAKNATL